MQINLVGDEVYLITDFCSNTEPYGVYNLRVTATDSDSAGSGESKFCTTDFTHEIKPNNHAPAWVVP
jgi:hypothetical protein